MTREEAIKKVTNYLTDNFDLSSKEIVKSFEFELVTKIYDAHEAELKTKDERIAELEAMVQKMCAECECAKFADSAIKPSEMWKLHLSLKDNK